MTENFETMPEEELICRAQSQDHAAIDALMRRYKGIVRKRARSLFMIGGDQDDLMQEGMIGLFKAIQDYDSSKEAVFSEAAELSPEEILIDRENVRNLREQIETALSPLEKKVFDLYMDGMTYQEIARQMKKEPKSIDTALQRFKTKVNKALKK